LRRLRLLEDQLAALRLECDALKEGRDRPRQDAQPAPMWVCQTCGHEWDDGVRPHCIACGTPYRVPNNVPRQHGDDAI
jgi:rubrerythrin